MDGYLLVDWNPISLWHRDLLLKEYRVFMGVNSDEERTKKYKLDQLRGAIFGMQMTSSDEHLLRYWFKKGGHKTPFFKKAQLSEDGFVLRYTDV